jgi:hypothetical protein
MPYVTHVWHRLDPHKTFPRFALDAVAACGPTRRVGYRSRLYCRGAPLQRENFAAATGTRIQSKTTVFFA